jgi:ERCC4-related helicase
VIALTATPGSDVKVRLNLYKNFLFLSLRKWANLNCKAVQNVIDKLLVSHIELRSDESIDIQQYNHGRDVKKFVLGLSDELVKIKNAFTNVSFDFQM